VIKEKITAKTDTVMVNVVETREVPVEVEKELTAWQTVRLKASGWMAAALLLIIVLAAFKNKLKLSNYGERRGNRRRRSDVVR